MSETIIWKQLTEFPDYYVSNTGLVKSNKRRKPKILKPYKMADGYEEVQLWVGCKKQHCAVHRLVALSFIPNPNNYPIVDHINGIRDDNRSINLQWLTSSGNRRKATNNQKVRRIRISNEEESVVYACVKDAAEFLRVSKCAIRQAIYRGSLCKTYKIQYADDISPKENIHIKGELFRIARYGELVFKNYRVSNKGRVMGVKGCIMAQSIINGYPSITMRLNGKSYTIRIHRLVAFTFIKGRTVTRNIINHLDEDKLNSDVDNLAWYTHRENTQYSSKGHKGVAQISLETGEIVGTFASRTAAAKAVGLKKSTSICDCCNGKRQSTAGYGWIDA